MPRQLYEEDIVRRKGKSVLQKYSKLLATLGLTERQANLYLTLLKTGKTDARMLATWSETPRTAVYRTLAELHKKGLVEKELGFPLKFKGVPPHIALQISIMQKYEECKEIEKKAREFLVEYTNRDNATIQEKDCVITILDGKRRIIQKIKEQHDNAKHTVDIISTQQRWLQITEECLDNCLRALSRGVKYRIILEVPPGGFNLSTYAHLLVEKTNFKIRKVEARLDSHYAVFDAENAIFNYYPSKAFGESPLILTNHPTFLSLSMEHFKKTWKTAK